MKWGYQPFQSLLFNARSENPQRKKMFAPLINTRRCAVIVEGYFQWNAQKEPFVFRPKKKNHKGSEDEKPIHFLLAALYATDGSVILFTREAIGEARSVHTRMPVLLDHNELDAWLDCEKYKYENIQAQIIDDQKEKWKSMFFYQIAPSVGDLKNKSEKVLMKAQEYDATANTSGIKRFFTSNSKEKKFENAKYPDYIHQDEGDDDEEDLEGEEQEQAEKKSIQTSQVKLEEKKEPEHEKEVKEEKDSQESNSQEEVKIDGLENDQGVKKTVKKSSKSRIDTTQESDSALKGKENKSAAKKETEKPSEMNKTMNEVKKALTEVGIESGKVIKARNAVIIVEKSDGESKGKEPEVNDLKENEPKAGNGLKKRKDYEGKSETEYVPDSKKMKRGNAPVPARR